MSSARATPVFWDLSVFRSDAGSPLTRTQMGRGEVTLESSVLTLPRAPRGTLARLTSLTVSKQQHPPGIGEGASKLPPGTDLTIH